MKLHKKIGGKRHREWAWALVVIMLCTAAVAVWGSQDGDSHTAATAQDKGAPATSQGSQAAKPADTSVVGVLAGIPEASAFNSYFVKDGVAAELGKGPYTIFVPTNAAIANLPKGTISGLSYSAQKRLVEYHIVAGKMLDNDAIKSGTYQALSKDDLNFNVDFDTAASYVNSGKILNSYRAQNGIIYTVSSVLFPPK